MVTELHLQLTFRFRRVPDGQQSQATNARGSGWDIEGCYCDAATRCSCVGNRNRVRMVSEI